MASESAATPAAPALRGRWWRQPARRPLIVTALLLLAWGASWSPSAAAISEETRLALALNVAWDRHDVDGVMALFGEHPEVSVRVVPPAPDDTAPAGAANLGQPETHAVSLTGREHVRAWVREQFARNSRVESRQYQAAGPQVTWTYRLFLDPYRQVAGVPPAEGTAAITVDAAHITALTATTTRASIERRAEALSEAAAAAMLRYEAAPPAQSADMEQAGEAGGEAGGAAGSAHPAARGGSHAPPPAALWAPAALLMLFATGLAMWKQPDQPRP